MYWYIEDTGVLEYQVWHTVLVLTDLSNAARNFEFQILSICRQQKESSPVKT